MTKSRVRSVYLGLWVTAAEKAQVSESARLRNVTVADFIRQRLGLSPIGQPDAWLKRMLSKRWRR